MLLSFVSAVFSYSSIQYKKNIAFYVCLSFGGRKLNVKFFFRFTKLAFGLVRVPVVCGSIRAGNSQSKERKKNNTMQREAWRRPKLGWDGGENATRTLSKFVACFDYGIPGVFLVRILSLWAGRESHKTGHPQIEHTTFSRSLSPAKFRYSF